MSYYLINEHRVRRIVAATMLKKTIRNLESEVMIARVCGLHDYARRCAQLLDQATREYSRTAPTEIDNLSAAEREEIARRLTPPQLERIAA